MARALLEHLAEDSLPEWEILARSIMDANYKPVFTSYRQMPLLVSELLRRGYGEDNVVKFVGGYFLRVFKAVREGQRA